MKFILQILNLLILTLTIQGCVTFPKSTLRNLPLTENSLTKLNGEYKVRAIKDSLVDNSYLDYHNVFEKFYRGKGRGSKDTMKIDNLDNYTFKIELIKNQQILVTYLKKGSSFRKFTIKYFLKDDGYIYLKNKNFKVLGIPYLIGSIDIKKLRLTTIDNYLLIEEVHHSSGAALLIFGDSKTWTYVHKYVRTE